jgi:hypothetical protein
LRNKSYYIFNKPYSKEAYAEYLAQYDLGSHQTIMKLKQEAHAFWRKNPMRYALVINCVNSTGEHIEHSKNLKWCYSVHDGENLSYFQFSWTPPLTDSLDVTHAGYGISRLYESVSCGEECDSIRFSLECWPSSREIEYSAFCRSSENLFGCVGLKKKKYCILNKQYSKEEYFLMREKIIAHMSEKPYVDSRNRTYAYGEFFPPEFSPFAYNETAAGDFLPLEKADAEAQGFLWREPEEHEFETTLDAGSVPDNIKDVADSVTQEIIKCQSCMRAYRVIPMELQFYRRSHLPLPRLCPDCRFRERFQFVNLPRFRKGVCMCAGKGSENGAYENTAPHLHDASSPCGNEFQTAFPPTASDILYCEKCYQAEVL